MERVLTPARSIAGQAAEHPGLACVLLANLLRVVGRAARRMTGEVALLAG